MKTSETITKITPALLLAQRLIGAVSKTNTAKVVSKRTGQSFSYSYADLTAVIDEIKVHLNDNDIIYLQPIYGDRVVTTLIHTSGEWISDEGVKIVCAAENDPQAQGSAITYARRYALLSLLGIPTEDDDATRAMPVSKIAKQVDDVAPHTDNDDPTSTWASDSTRHETKTIIGNDICPIHEVQMEEKQGQYGPFFSHYDPDNGYCSGKGWKAKKS